MRVARRGKAPLLAAVLALAGCATTPPSPAPPPRPVVGAIPVTDAATAGQVDVALAGSQRLATDAARDAWRHPRQTLDFFGLRRDMTVMEVWPDAGGWYTRILAPVLRDHGKLIVATRDPAGGGEYARRAAAAFRAGLEARPAVFDRVEAVVLQPPSAVAPVPAGSVDMVLSFRGMHDWMARDVAVAMFRALYAALKPGGILGVVDHRAAPNRPADALARSGYVREDVAIGLIESVGFQLLGQSEVNANPADDRDHRIGVWALPPTLRFGPRDRERYLQIGESDRFTLRFRKPVDAN